MAQDRFVVGFIGLGAMGSPMAERLVQAGEDVIVYNRKSAKRRGFEIAPESRARPRKWPTLPTSSSFA